MLCVRPRLDNRVECFLTGESVGVSCQDRRHCQLHVTPSLAPVCWATGSGEQVTVPARTGGSSNTTQHSSGFFIGSTVQLLFVCKKKIAIADKLTNAQLGGRKSEHNMESDRVGGEVTGTIQTVVMEMEIVLQNK